MSKMKNILIVICCMFVFGALAQKTTQPINVMTYNLRFGELASLEEIADFVKGENPDIVALQECDWKTERDRAPKQNGKAFVNELAFHTGMFGLYGKAIDYKGGYYGVGILSKYPVLRSERIFLPNPNPKKEQRVLLVADIEMPDKSVLTFICTHLEVSTAEKRGIQIEFINNYAKDIGNPVILAGDMNAKPFDKEIQEGFADWQNMTNEEFTFSTVKPSIKIDYIYAYPKDKMEMISTQVHTDILLSDHFPVSSMIKIKQ